jgi:hypothetical protein
MKPLKKHRKKVAAVCLTLMTMGAGLGLSPSSSAAARPAITSTFIKIDDAFCVKVAGVEDEDWATLRCGEKVDGWQVFVEYGDLRESISLKRNGVVADLNFGQFSGGFSNLGRTLEFRVQNGKAIAAVVGHIHSTSPDNPDMVRSAVMVAKLSPKPCVVANVDPGPQQKKQTRVARDKAISLPCLVPTP